jgi:hypothetical protein
LEKWIGRQEQEQEFIEVVDFVGEMLDESTRQRIRELDLPSLWKARLAQQK